MKKYFDYRELDVWKAARELCSEVYLITKNFPKNEMFSLTLQIRKSSVSIPSNIAEGCGRNTAKDTLQFLFVARGSLYELETQFLIAADQKYFSTEDLENILEKIVKCRKLLSGFISYFQKQVITKTSSTGNRQPSTDN